MLLKIKFHLLSVISGKTSDQQSRVVGLEEEREQEQLQEVWEKQVAEEQQLLQGAEVAVELKRSQKNNNEQNRYVQ